MPLCDASTNDGNSSDGVACRCVCRVHCLTRWCVVTIVATTKKKEEKNMGLQEFLVGLWGAKGILLALGLFLAVTAISGKWIKYRAFKPYAIGAGVLLSLGILVPPVWQAMSLGQSVSPAQLPGASLALSGCGDVTSVTVGQRVFDDEAGPLLGYAANQVYFKRLSDGKIEEDGAASTAGTYATETLNPCEEYEVQGITNWGANAVGSSSTNVVKIQTGKVAQEVSLHASNQSLIQIRAKDVVSDAYDFLFQHDTATGTNQTTYTSLNDTNIFDDAAAADLNIGLDGRIDYEMLFRAATTNTKGSDPNLKWWICVDEGSDGEWTEPSVSIDGVKLVDGKASMQSTDLIGPRVAASDWCYPVLSSIDDIGRKLNFVMQADSGQNPDTTNDDVRVCLLPEGKFVSSRSPDTIKFGVYNDAASPALVSVQTGTNPCFDFNIQ